MQTLQVLLIGGILALVADLAVGPPAKFAQEYECAKSQQCEDVR